MTMERAAQPAKTLPDGAGLWPRATPFRAQWPSLTETLEAEFNIAQMRALARLWDIRLKGSSRSGFVEQVAQALSERVSRMRADPEALLEGLPADQAELARRLLTARDYELPVPRSLAASLWRRQTGNSDEARSDEGRAPDRSLAEALDALRRRALIFPTNRYTGYRDVYYQWLPLAASGGHVPVRAWAVAPYAPADSQSPSGHANSMRFLDAFDLFLNAVMSTGARARAALPAHPQADRIAWLRRWEHDAEEAGRLLNSRPGWAPDPRSGISVPLTGWLSSDARATLENQTGLPAEQCEFLFSVAAGLQLIEAPPEEAGRRVGARMDAVEAWYALSGEQRFLRAWTAWQELIPDPLEAASAARHTPFKVMRAVGARDMGPLDLGAEWCALRRYLFRVLRGLPRGQWIDWPALRRALFDFHPDCAWTFMTPDHWWFAAPDGLMRLQHSRYDEWARSVGAVLEAALRGPLRWFGLIEAQMDTQAGNSLAAFRVTDMVAWLMQAQIAANTADSPTVALPALPATAAPQPRTLAPVVWRDAVTWHLPPAPERADFIVLARKIGEPAEAPFTYRLTPASIQAGLREGITADEVAAQFERFGAPMPESALALYRAIAERYGRVRVYESLAVLQLSDDYALPELLANTSLAQAIVFQISPRAIVIRPDSLDALVREFVERGYTPSVS